MSDLEDLDLEAEDTSLDDELAAPAEHPAKEEDGTKAGGGSDVLKNALADKGLLMKAGAALAVVVVGGGAYFMLSSHHAASKRADAQLPQHVATTMTAPVTASQKIDKLGGVDSSWNSGASSHTVSGQLPPASAPTAVPKLPDLLPAAIPPAPSSGATTPATPPIVNEMPPSSAQLSNAGGAAPVSGSPAAAVPSPFASAPSAPASVDAPGLPGMPPAVSATPSPPASATPGQVPAFMPVASVPDAIPAVQPSPAKMPVKAPFVKNEQTMPSAPVAPVDIDADKSGINKPEAAAMPSTAGQSAQVEELQKKIEDLEKTIIQLQQATVEKEDAEGKSVEEAATGAAPHHARSSHHTAQRTAASRHAHKAVSAKWVLKAAKPGVAWVAKPGSDDLHMVETGDNLTGIGNVTSITRDSSGAWVVSGTKGRISQ